MVQYLLLSSFLDGHLFNNGAQSYPFCDVSMKWPDAFLLLFKVKYLETLPSSLCDTDSPDMLEREFS